LNGLLIDCLFAASAALMLIELMAPVNYCISYLLYRFLLADYYRFTRESLDSYDTASLG
jgi:hypothetical protein